MLPRILAALLILAGPALAQGSGTQGAGTTDASKPATVPGTGDVATVPGTRSERSGGAGNPGSAAAPGTTPSGGGTGQLRGNDVTSGGSAAGNR